MMKIVQYRFNKFRETFGRDPKPDEPLFFYANRSRPIAAHRGLALRQICEASETGGIDVLRLLRFLGF
jgi:hypothetical protein